ncbi:hypothetical protein Glove_290g54 [Diversispora epigaea]|uniref:Uncharacterized protein n=1 Tax=Diversispora epigaea TaxID=1348612 RepID=A0A397I6X7_9GLOM|nr:hypothetical protein Glove_290g54 [Diversispora epigaea]
MKSAERGNICEQNNLECYQHEIGTIEDETKELHWYAISVEGGNKKIFRWYLILAEEENTNGQNKLGYCYLLGIGTTQDDEKTFHWYIMSTKGLKGK